MKLLLAYCCLFLLISCNNKKKVNTKPAFIIGDWIRTNNKKGTTTYENWKSNLRGIGYTIKENDTVFKEIMSIVSLNDTLFLKVEGVNEQPTFFKFTNKTDTSFVCENPKNEFPKKIIYYKENAQLKAVVSTGDYKIDFVFEKVN